MDEDRIEVLLKNVYKFPGSTAFSICLAELGENLAGKRCLFISTNAMGAIPIINMLQHAEYAHPLIHDLLKTAIEELGGTIEKIIITELKDNIYQAEITVMRPDKQMIYLDSRSTDALAMALRASCRIYVNRGVWDKLSEPYIRYFPEEAPPSVQKPRPDDPVNTGSTENLDLEEMPTHDLKKMEQIFKDLPKPNKDKLS